METNVNYTLAGLFVLILLTALTMGVIFLSAGITVQSYTTYKIYMKESVSGLSLDGPVEFNGVNVGTVKSIEISQKDPQLVELLISIKSSTPVSQGTRAMLNTRGFTGLAYLTLQDKGTDLRKLTIKPGETYAVIYTSPSLFLRLDAAFNQFSQNFHQISLSIQQVLNPNNLRSFKEILQNLQATTQQLAPLIQSGNTTLEVFSTQTLPTANQAMANIESLTRNMLSISADLKENPAILLRGKTPPVLGPGEHP